MNSKEIFYVARHPILAVETYLRQSAVGIEHSVPPLPSTIEDFPRLSLSQAMKILYEAKITYIPEYERNGGVPKSAWSKADQERMDRGEQPQGYPLHPNL